MDLTKLKGSLPDSVIAQIPDVISKFKIDSPLRLANFLGQCAHESVNFTATEENLYYSADGLKKFFERYFPGDTSKAYAKKPEAIASRVYASRMGNGDELSKEGFKFKGRGFIQLTGKDNYSQFDLIVEDNILQNPDLVATKYPLLSAAWFWNKASLNSVADLGMNNETITKVTRKVNGGTNGLDDRIAKTNKYYNLLK